MKNLLTNVCRLLVGMVFIVGAGQSPAQTWEATSGPLGGPARTIAIDSTGEVFVGSRGGIFHSTNGDTWQKTGGNVSSSFLTSMLVSADSNHLFVGTTNAGLFKSTDNGNTWIRQNSVLPTSNVQAISNGLNGELLVGSDRDGVFRSPDNGESWNEFNNGLADLRIFAVAQSANGDFYAGTIATGIYRYVDSDTTWISVSGGLGNKRIAWLEAFGSDEMLAGTGSGVYKIAAGDTAWTQFGNNIGFVNSLFLDTPGQIFATTLNGVFLYDTASDSWNSRSNGVTNLRTWDVVSNATGNLFLVSDAGIFRSQDNGASWTYQVDGFKISRVKTLGGFSDGTILAGTESNGFFRTTNDGMVWVPSNTGLTNLGIRVMVMDPNSVIFAGISGLSGVARSMDQGNSWEIVKNGFIGSNVAAIALGGNRIYAASSSAILSSADGGDSWQAMPDSGLTTNSVRALTVNADGVLFAGTSNRGVFRIAENDSIWTEVNNGLTRLFTNSLTIDGSGNLFVGISGAGVFRSTDNGDNWIEANQGLPSTFVLSFAIAPWGDLFACTSAGVAQSGDNGDNWTVLSDGLTNAFVNSLYIRSNNEVFAGTNGDGVYHTTVNPLTSVDEIYGTIPTAFTLKQNYPNPFNPATTISFSIDEQSDLRLVIYDLLGREVRTLLQKNFLAGSYSVVWEGTDNFGNPVASGHYFYQLKAGEVQFTKRMVFLK